MRDRVELEMLTRILCHKAASLELLDGNPRPFREKENIPVQVPHDGSRNTGFDGVTARTKRKGR